MLNLLLALWLVTVHHVGELRQVIDGQDGGVIELSSLRGHSHLYALGPLAHREGEITIFDGEFLVSRVVDGQAQVTGTDRGAAAFLVYSQVPHWRKVLDFEGELPNLDPLIQQPSPFLVRGTARRVDLHILDRQGQPATGPEAHRRLQVHFSRENCPVEVLGFWSDRHHGLFTPASSNLHLHARVLDQPLMGHVESLEMEAGELWLPDQEPCPPLR